MEPVGRADRTPSPDAEEFVRFCYRRRRVGWPELYDEMCAVATRGLFRGMDRTELAEVGIGFSLFETRRLAELVGAIVADEQARRVRLAAPVIAARAAAVESVSIDAPEPTAVPAPPEPVTEVAAAVAPPPTQRPVTSEPAESAPVAPRLVAAVAPA